MYNGAELKTPAPATTNFLFLLLVLYSTLFFRLGDLALVGADEPRYARVAEEMLQSGDYIVPTLHGKPWLEKPPLYYWLTAAAYRAFGVSEASARLPSALGSALSVLLLWWVVRRLADEDAAVLAALTASTAPLFFVFGRAASTDALFCSLLSAALLLCLYGLLEGRAWPYLASGAALGLSTLAKGPVALVLAAAIVLPALALHPSARRFARLALALLVCLVVAVPWYWLIIRRTGFEFISVFLLNHNLARFFTTLHHHDEPFYYYLGVLALGTYPWTVPLFWCRGRHWRNLRALRLGDSSFQIGHWAEDPRLIFLASWILLPLLFFSLSQSKLPAYVLPLVLPLSLYGALLLSQIDEVSLQRRRRRVMGLLLTVSVLLAAIATTALGRLYNAAWRGALLGIVFVGAACLAWKLSRRALSGALLALAGGNVVAVLVLTTAVLPSVEPYHSTRKLVQDALLRLPPEERFYQYRTFHHTIDYYSGGRTVMESIDSLEDLRGTLQTHSPLWLILETQDVPALQDEADLDVRILNSRGQWSVVRLAKSEPRPSGGAREVGERERGRAGEWETR